MTEYTIKKLNSSQAGIEEEKNPIDVERDNRFYRLKLDENSIHLIDSPTKFEHFLNEMDTLSKLKSPLYVGVDSEWKPTCVSGVAGEHVNKVALIQISTETNVYLLDMIALKMNKTQASAFSSRFFTNKNIIKLGYGFSHDIRIILHSIGCSSDADAFRHTVLDLAYIVNQVRERLDFNL